MAYNVKVTASAEKDLDDIVGYIVRELCNPQAAAHFLDEITDTYRVLADTPFGFPACSQPLLRKYRKITVMRYVILYRIDENTVFVERIFSQLEDYAHKL